LKRREYVPLERIDKLCRQAMDRSQT
jgi:hypothetical protein